MKRFIVLLGLAVLAVVVARGALYTVDAAEYAYVTVLGQHVATHDGGDTEHDAGLHLGWPWPVQAVQRLDRRLQLLDLDSIEVLTRDPQGQAAGELLIVQAFLTWRIADRTAVDRFVRRIGSLDRARGVLTSRVNSQIAAAISKSTMSDLVGLSRDPVTQQLHIETHQAQLQAAWRAELSAPILDEYGIEIVDIRIRRFSHPANVRASTFDTIRSERSRKVAEIDADAQQKASKIVNEAEQQRRTLLADAKAQEARIRGEGETEATRIRLAAHAQDPEFYGFLKQMDKLQTILSGEKTLLLLSTHRAMFDSLFTPPRPKKQDKK